MATIGKTTIGASTYNWAGWANSKLACKVTMPKSGAIISLSAYENASINDTHTSGYYADSSGSPATLLGQGSGQTVTTTWAWYTYSYSGGLQVSAQTLWLIIHITGGYGQIKYDSGATNQTGRARTSPDPLPLSDPFGTVDDWMAYDCSIYATVLYAPSNCQNQASGGNAINVSWTDEADNEDDFHVERSTNGGAWTEITTRNANVTSYLDTSVSPGNTYQYRVRTHNHASSVYTQYSTAPTTVSVTVHVPTPRKRTQSVYTRPQICVEQMTNSRIRLNRCLDFDGTNDYVSVPDNAALDFANASNISIEAWIYPYSVNTSKCMLAKGRPNVANTNSCNYYLGVVNDEFEFGYRNSADTAWHIYTTSTANMTANTPYHVIVTYTFGTGASIAIYLNGNTTPLTGSWTTGTGNDAPIQNNYALLIGLIHTDSPTQQFDGLMDEPRIYSRILSTTEVAQHYAKTFGSNANLQLWLPFSEGTGTSTADKSTNAFTGTISGASWATYNFTSAFRDNEPPQLFHWHPTSLQISETRGLGIPTFTFTLPDPYGLQYNRLNILDQIRVWVENDGRFELGIRGIVLERNFTKDRAGSRQLQVVGINYGGYALLRGAQLNFSSQECSTTADSLCDTYVSEIETQTRYIQNTGKSTPLYSGNYWIKIVVAWTRLMRIASTATATWRWRVDEGIDAGEGRPNLRIYQEENDPSDLTVTVNRSLEFQLSESARDIMNKITILYSGGNVTRNDTTSQAETWGICPDTRDYTDWTSSSTEATDIGDTALREEANLTYPTRIIIPLQLAAHPGQQIPLLDETFGFKNLKILQVVHDFSSSGAYTILFLSNI